MTAEEKRDLRCRAQRVLCAAIPASIRDGSASRSGQYRDDAAVIAAFVRRGVQAERAVMALARLEGVQRGDR